MFEFQSLATDENNLSSVDSLENISAVMGRESLEFPSLATDESKLSSVDSLGNIRVSTPDKRKWFSATRREDMDKILFYQGRWYFFSSFSSFMVKWRGTDWITSEHAYQAAKFDDPAIIEEIRNARSAYDAKVIAYVYDHKKIPNWYEIRLGIMEEIVRAKLEQHSYIRRKLLETGEREIIEDSPTDSFWGRGPDWKGENHLGKIWMNLRKESREELK